MTLPPDPAVPLPATSTGREVLSEEEVVDGMLVWYRPAVVGYGYDYGRERRGIKAVVVGEPWSTLTDRFGYRWWVRVTFMTHNGDKRIYTHTVIGNIEKRVE